MVNTFSVAARLDHAPLVTIAVVTYNHSAFISDTIQSCLLQAEDYPNLEILVADDASTDGTQDIIADWVARYPQIIKPVLSQENGGIARNMNKALDAASGQYLAWLGGDDLMLKGKIEKQVAFLEADPSACGCYHDADVFEWPGGRSLGTFSHLYAGRAATADYVTPQKMLDPRFQMLPSTLMLRRDRVEHRVDTRFIFHNDFLFDLECIVSGGPLKRMEGTFTRYRKHAGSVGRSEAAISRMLEENLMVLAVIDARYPEYAKTTRRRAAYYLTLEAVRCARKGDLVRMRRISGALVLRGNRLMGYGVRLLHPILGLLLKPEHRELAVRIRSIFG